jgi:hypothetical protein
VALVAVFVLWAAAGPVTRRLAARRSVPETV